jgi:hypothetical protein
MAYILNYCRLFASYCYCMGFNPIRELYDVNLFSANSIKDLQDLLYMRCWSIQCKYDFWLIDGIIVEKITLEVLFINLIWKAKYYIVWCQGAYIEKKIWVVIMEMAIVTLLIIATNKYIRKKCCYDNLVCSWHNSMGNLWIGGCCARIWIMWGM